MDAGDEAIEDPETRRQLRAQATRIHVQSIVVAALVTALILALPD